ncbi:MAG: acyl carrier protein, partial [Mycobacterium sp.]
MASEECAPPILALVRGLVAEVHPHATPPSVTLDSTFDNLGIGSLELAELLLRVQDKFGVALPPHILASAETPRDLLAAVASGQPAMVEDRGIVSLPATARGVLAPDTTFTLNDALKWNVRATPDRTHT